MDMNGPISWYREAILISNGAPLCKGAFSVCLREWDKLPSQARSRSSIIAESDIYAPEYLGRLVTRPDYLALR